MKHLLSVVLVASIWLVVCNAYCFTQPPKKVKHGEEPVNGCILEGELHPPGTWRTKSCLDCSCGSNGSIKCCSVGGRPVNYDKKRCRFKYDREACTYILIPNEDPEMQCTSYGMVG